MPPGLLPRGCLLLVVPHLRRHLPALCSTLRSSHSHKRPGAFFSPVRAVSGYSAMAAGSPEQQQRSVVVKETVELTETEERIFRRLLEVVRHFSLGTQLRVAGGWVRDKVSFFILFFRITFSCPVGRGLVEYQKEVDKFQNRL
jgi:hypothetical protein